MIEFKVRGPFRINIIKHSAAKILNSDFFWDSDKQLHDLSERTGVYVFAIKPSKATSFTPYYVGQATKGFNQEIFTSDNLLKYYKVLADFQKGFPAFFFVVEPRKQGPINKKAISEVETYFTQLCGLVNPNTQNVQGIKPPRWSIGGLIRSKTKKTSHSAKDFAEMFELGANNM